MDSKISTVIENCFVSAGLSEDEKILENSERYPRWCDERRLWAVGADQQRQFL